MAGFTSSCAFVILVLSSLSGHSSGFATSSSNDSLLEGDKIVGGVQASPNEFRWIVTVMSAAGYFCGGSLISDSWVLTAAHCCVSSPSYYTITGGAYDLSRPNGNEIQQSVQAVVQHPAYNSMTGENDIGLMKLAEPFSFSSSIGSIPLAPPNYVTDGVSCTVAGWGLTSENSAQPTILRKVVIAGVPNAACQLKKSIDESSRNKTQKQEQVGEEVEDRIFDSQICAGGKGLSSCYGDSGSSYMCPSTIDGSFLLAGCVSGGQHCGNSGVYTRISGYLPWIQSNLNSQ